MITERLMGTGRWDLSLEGNTPSHILETLKPANSGYGNIVITPEHMDVSEQDAILPYARYSGPLRKRREGTRISGCGSNYWFMGDEDKKGAFIGTLSTANGYFTQWLTLLRHAWLSAGITENIPNSNPYAKPFPRGPVAPAIAELSEFWGLEWRVRPNWKLDWAYPATLFRTTPAVVIRPRRDEGGREVNVVGIVGELEVTEDVEDWSRIVDLTYNTTSHRVESGGVPVIDVPFRTPIGTEISIIRYATGRGGDIPTGAEIPLAYAEWAKTSQPRNEFRLSADHYDIAGEIAVGDALDVFDERRGLVDFSRQREYRGETLFPVPVRCLGYSWPVLDGMGVYFRRHRKVGASWVLDWIDLTPYVKWDKGSASVDVGALPRTI